MLAAWFVENGRTFLWRSTADAWTVLLAEFLLRRTRADQVQNLLPTILTHFPMPSDLASASEEEVQLVFRSAGLIERIRQLHSTANLISELHVDTVPVDPDELIELPGVGPYVADAVAARLGERDVVLVDTNTVRVATRVLGTQPSTKDPRRERAVIDAVGKLLGGPASAELWWAVIDLAHLICTPRDPDCESCPLNVTCAYATDQC